MIRRKITIQRYLQPGKETQVGSPDPWLQELDCGPTADAFCYSSRIRTFRQRHEIPVADRARSLRSLGHAQKQGACGSFSSRNAPRGKNGFVCALRRQPAGQRKHLQRGPALLLCRPSAC